MEFIPLLQQKLQELSNPERANQMSAYMRHQFEFFGVMAGPRKQVLKEVFKEVGIPQDAFKTARALFSLPQRELHICAQELLLKARQQWTKDSISEFEWFIIHNSWWDSVDFIASNVVGPYLIKFPENTKKVQQWASTDNLWLQRTAILYQLKYRLNTDTEWLWKVISMHSHQDEFFIKKAIGWALREYSKYNPDWVSNFVASHELKPLSVKEGLRIIKK
ncbi:MAG: DNA alkylation repair protein [Bacteroidia bacterium]